MKSRELPVSSAADDVRTGAGLADDGHAERWMAAMRRGDFAAAWTISDTVLGERRRRPQTHWHLPRHLQPVWDGSPLDGKRVLVRCYHGLGDTLQFVRFAAPLRERAAHVTLWAQPELMGLLRSVPGVDAVLPLHDGPPDADFDVDIEVMELAHALRITLADLPGGVPYLLPSKRRNEVAAPAAPMRVGVVWRAGDWDPRRSIPAEAMAALRGVPGVSLHSLQLGPSRAEAALLGAADLADADVDVTALRLQEMDLVICPDTMMAHLAGALGRPVWTLLPCPADWRWMDEREDSPWYPTMRLFRQSAPGRWDDVIQSVRCALEQHCGLR